MCSKRVGLITAEEARAAEYARLLEGDGGGDGGESSKEQQEQQLPSKEEADAWMGCALGAASDEESA